MTLATYPVNLARNCTNVTTPYVVIASVGAGSTAALPFSNTNPNRFAGSIPHHRHFGEAGYLTCAPAPCGLLASTRSRTSLWGPRAKLGCVEFSNRQSVLHANAHSAPLA